MTFLFPRQREMRERGEKKSRIWIRLHLFLLLKRRKLSKIDSISKPWIQWDQFKDWISFFPFSFHSFYFSLFFNFFPCTNCSFLSPPLVQIKKEKKEESISIHRLSRHDVFCSKIFQEKRDLHPSRFDFFFCNPKKFVFLFPTFFTLSSSFFTLSFSFSHHPKMMVERTEERFGKKG